jgi:sulfotransferase
MRRRARPSTVRADTLAARDRLIGYAWSALKEAYYGDDAGRLLLVEYDILCQRPAETMKLIYGFIGEEPFDHDFENVVYDAEEFDIRLGTPACTGSGGR